MANEFNPQGRSKYLFVPLAGIDDPAAPTADELDTETVGVLDITCGILPNGVEGFSSEPTTVDSSTMCSKRAETVAGLPTTTDGAFTMKRASTSGTANYTLMNALIALAGTFAEGYVVFVPDGWADDETGPAVGDVVDVFSSALASVNSQPAVAGQVGSYKVGFTHPGAFALNRLVTAGS
jgi:hypothetical protein